MKKKEDLLFPALIAASLLGCPSAHMHGPEEAPSESWAVTAWGESFEIFAETDGLEVGVRAIAFTHVTVLEDFSPLTEGIVSVVLRGPDGSESLFSIDQPTRAGIFSIPVEPEKNGELDLFFRVEGVGHVEEIPAGRVRVGDPGDPGGLVALAPQTTEAEIAVRELVGQAALSFLKEQQWRTDFRTGWLRAEGSLRDSAGGPGQVRPAAAGEVLFTSPVDGVVRGTPWPYPGQSVRRGEPVLRVIPTVASDRSLAELEAAAATLEAEHEGARLRLERLNGLLDLGATSRRELEEASTLESTLANRLEAARKDLAIATTGRRGTSPSAGDLAIKAPFAGRIARIDTTHGEVVAAGDPVGLLVQETPLWVEVALRPDVAAGLGDPVGVDLRISHGEEPLTFRDDAFRLVSRSPMVDSETGTVSVFFEVAADAATLPIGAPVEAEILLAGERGGIVVPESALVDDGGVTVVYLQTEGESFLRAEVTVVARQSGAALVDGLAAGARYVERGGNAIRRSALVSQDVGEGHVH